MKSKNYLKFLFVPLFLLVAVIAARVFFYDRFEEVSFRIFDKFQQIKPRIYQDVPVRFVDLDDESLQKLGQWPWPRTQTGELVQKLAQAGASVVVLDILFAEPDRTSPARMLPLWKNIPELETLQAQAGKLPDHDDIFSKIISQANVVTGFTLTNEPSRQEPVLKAGFAHSGEDPLQYLPQFKGTITNLPALEKAASGSGSFNFIAERDGVLRRVPIIFRYQDKIVPSLVAEALRAAQGASSYIVKSSGASGEINFGEDTGITSVKIGEFVIPTDASGKFWLYDTGKVLKRYVPAWQIMEGTFDPALIEGNIIYIGSSAAGLKDLRITPLDPVMAGTEVHVQLTEQVLLQEFLNRPDWAFGAEIIFLLFLGLLLIFLLPRLGALWCAILGIAFLTAAFGFSWHMYTQNHQLIDPVTPSLALLLIYFTVSLMNYLRTEAERSQVRNAFSRYVSPGLLQKISDHPEQLKLGGETRNMTVFFSDIRNFTSISENLSAEELTRFMNRYLTPMTDIILKTSATVDKYIGDAVMAFWNAPFADPDHARHACEAALAMRARMKTWNLEMEEEAKSKGKNFSPVSIGIGLNTGPCSVGNMGSDQRFDYSVLGDDVNLASRLEGQSKIYGVDIVLGEKTRGEAPDFAALELDLIRVKGKEKPAKIYTLLGDGSLKQSADFKNLEDSHRKMLEVYRSQNWKEALGLIEEFLKKETWKELKPLYLLYRERVQTYLAAPPVSSWDGVYTAITK